MINPGIKHFIGPILQRRRQRMRLVQILQLLVLETRIEWKRCDSPTQMLNPFLDFFRTHREVFFSHLHWDKPKMKELTPSRHSQAKGRDAPHPHPSLPEGAFICLSDSDWNTTPLPPPPKQANAAPSWEPEVPCESLTWGITCILHPCPCKERKSTQQKQSSEG